MNKQYLYLLAGFCAAIIAWLAPDTIKQNYNQPQFWYAVIAVLAIAIFALTVNMFTLAKRINPKTHLL